MSIETWMPQVKALYGAVSGIAQVHAPEDLPASLMAFPCVVLMPTRGAAYYPMIVHALRAVLYFSAQVLPEAQGLAVPYIEAMRRVVIQNVQMGGLVAAWYLPPEGWYEGPGGVAYGDKIHTGIIFNSFVKEQETIEPAAGNPP